MKKHKLTDKEIWDSIKSIEGVLPLGVDGAIAVRRLREQLSGPTR